MNKKSANTFLISLLCPFMLLCLSGCTMVAEHLHTMVVSKSTATRAVHKVEHTYIGTTGPLSIWVENERGIRATMELKAVRIPDFQDRVSLGLSLGEIEGYRKKAEIELRNYFGGRKKIRLITYRKVKGPESQNHLIDAKSPSQAYTACEVLITKGLAIVNKQVANIASRNHLLNIQHKAKREKVGIWSKLIAHPENWR